MLSGKKMYETFAHVYDTFMDEVPYDDWAAFLIREMKKAGIRQEPLLLLLRSIQENSSQLL